MAQTWVGANISYPLNAFDAAAKDGRTDELRGELVALFESQNQCQYPGNTLIAATFLRVTVEVG